MYNATLYMSDRRKQLDHVADVPVNNDELKPYVNLRCSGLTLELERVQADPGLKASLEQREITEMTEAFGRELFEVVAGIHTRVVDYFWPMLRLQLLPPLRVTRQSTTKRWRR